MDSGTLVNRPDFEEGKKAVAAIKEAGIPLRLAFWAYFDSAAEWRFVVVTPLVEREGPRSVYASIQRAFTKDSVTIPLRLVVLAAPKDPIAQLGINSDALVRPFGGGYVSTSTGVTNVTVDPRYIYHDN